MDVASFAFWSPVALLDYKQYITTHLSLPAALLRMCLVSGASGLWRTSGAVQGNFRRAIFCGLPALGGFARSSVIFNSLIERVCWRCHLHLVSATTFPRKLKAILWLEAADSFLVPPAYLINISLSVISTPLSLRSKQVAIIDLWEFVFRASSRMHSRVSWERVNLETRKCLWWEWCKKAVGTHGLYLRFNSGIFHA